MGVALFIALEREVEGIDAGAVGGNFLARNLAWLDGVAKKLAVRPLSEFISVSPEEAEAFLEGEDADPAGSSLPSTQWFHAEEGLKTIDLLLQHTQSQKPGENALLRDLRDAKQVLERARDNNVRFHFAVDF